MLTVMIILVLVAFVFTIANIMNPPRAPLWVAVLFLCIIELLRIIPLGR